MKNKKLLIIIAIVLIAVVIVTSVIIIVKKTNDEKKYNDNNDGVVNNGVENSGNTENLRVTGKLAKYIQGLTNNYYIKYSGNFMGDSGKTINTIVEYTKSKEDFAIRVNDLNIHLICEDDKLYSISSQYKMIVQMNKESFDITQYNLASDMGQTFVKSYKEILNNVEYDVEEYTYNGTTIKYYFISNDLKIIRYNLEDIKVIRVEKNTNTTLLKKPEGYSIV